MLSYKSAIFNPDKHKEAVLVFKHWKSAFNSLVSLFFPRNEPVLRQCWFHLGSLRKYFVTSCQSNSKNERFYEGILNANPVKGTDPVSSLANKSTQT